MISPGFQPLFIRADANTRMGTGHIMRCLALAQAWHSYGGRVVFLSCLDSPSLRKRILDEGFEFNAIEKPCPHPADLSHTLDYIAEATSPNKQNWVVLDGYHFDAGYQGGIKATGHKLLCIDDFGHTKHYAADIVLNQNISADESVYKSREPYTRLLLGTRYVLLRKEFCTWIGWQRTIPEIAKNIIVTMGGSDLENVTLKVIEAIKGMDDPSLEIKVVVGPANPHMATLRKAIASAPGTWNLLENVSNMPEIMAWADMAVSGGGSTCWELLLLQVPSALFIMTENQCLIAKKLEQLGIFSNMGWHDKSSVSQTARNIHRISNDQKLRIKMVQNCVQIIDGLGVERVIKMMDRGIGGNE